MGEPADARRFRANLQDEIDSTATYEALAGMATQPEIAEVYQHLADEERRHADLWRTKLREAGADPASFPTQPGWRTRLLIALARRFGPGLILPTLMEREQTDSGKYDEQPEATAAGLPGTERSHARIFAAIAGSSGGALEGRAVARLEGRRHCAGGNALRAAVLGANDGLVSNASLVMGVAGANLAATSILLTGLSGLLAGSLSMALGEWLSVQSARELNRNQIALEAEELEAFPEEEANELELIYRAKGIPADQAKAMAERIVSDRSSALDTLAREELGIDPEELGGGDHLVRAFRGRGYLPGRPVFRSERLDGGRRERGAERDRPLRPRRAHHRDDRPQRLVLRRPPGRHRHRRRRHHLHRRQADRRRHRMMPVSRGASVGEAERRDCRACQHDR